MCGVAYQQILGSDILVCGYVQVGWRYCSSALSMFVARANQKFGLDFVTKSETRFKLIGLELEDGL